MPDDMGSLRVDVEVENPLRPGLRKLLLVSMLLGPLGCGDGKRPEPAADAGAAGALGAAPDISRTTFAPSLGVDLAAMRQTPRGAWIRDLTLGTGAAVGAGTQVAIHYVGALPDGKQFDANGPADQPFVFRIDAGEVVPGFDEGVLGMKAGGRRQVIIPPALGYGAQGNGPIPGNSILVFTIDLVRVQ
jgi:FKBP-type peptidyl-prolyl cis-trans isomerase FkpA